MIFITYLAVICFDPITPQSVEEDQANLLISEENQGIVASWLSDSARGSLMLL